ncbi:CBO0543 family protein [Lentibacillus jeotgali]|uniref:CBO0543 family protein n=1 Tax=Lentibacillus jeotgali TaxID=558169 RepID=UPI000262880C|nr:CBO0543 family protein [Lentibacillus jeotgali]
MKQKYEKFFLGILTLLGIAMIPVWFNKRPRKDWTIVFLLAGFLSGMLDLFVTALKLIRYPTKIFGEKLNISLLFDYLLLPNMGVLYNQFSYKSGFWEALAKSLLFSIPMTTVEYHLEKRTNLVIWEKWNWFYTFISVTLFLWLERGFMALIRKYSNPRFALVKKLKRQLRHPF